MNQTIGNIVLKIYHKFIKLRLQPIRVLCFHQISEIYDDTIYCKPDWISTNFLKNYLLEMKRNGYQFISLLDAHRHIQRDIFRRKKLAVLTADDGLKCQVNILPWLQEQQIPLTLFLNIATLDARTCGEAIKKYFNIEDKIAEQALAEKLYLNEEQLTKTNSPILTIANHGYDHSSALAMKESQFVESIAICVSVFSKRPDYISFYAYPYGAHSPKMDAILHQMKLIPVYADGQVNYNDATCIHREMITI